MDAMVRTVLWGLPIESVTAKGATPGTAVGTRDGTGVVMVDRSEGTEEDKGHVTGQDASHKDEEMVGTIAA